MSDIETERYGPFRYAGPELFSSGHNFPTSVDKGIPVPISQLSADIVVPKLICG